MASRRPSRVAQAMRHVLSELILREVKDPRVRMVTITAVDLSPDLRHATVSFSCSGDEQEREKVQTGLQRAGGFLRSHLTKELRLRYAPDLRFEYDRSLDRAEEISRLMRDIVPPEESGDD